jgi:serine/threonine protein kinase
LASPNVPDLTGSTIGEYEIVSRLGIGGMGVVYEGRQPVIGKRVAVKVLLPQLSHDNELVERFVSEARAVNEIGHRGIVDIFSFGQLPTGQHYFVMEFLAGLPFDRLVKTRGAIPPEEVLWWSEEICDALQGAHEAGIIHRDIKPSNLFLVDTGRGRPYVKLLDFGIAKLGAKDGESTPQTRASVVVGTPDYMSPEQARGKAVSPSTDVYALGCVMFELLTGKRAFKGENALETMFMHVENAPPKLRDFVPDALPELESLLLWTMEKDPLARPATAEELRLQIAAIRKLLPEVVLLPRPSPSRSDLPMLSPSGRQLPVAMTPRPPSSAPRRAESGSGLKAAATPQPLRIPQHTVVRAPRPEDLSLIAPPPAEEAVTPRFVVPIAAKTVVQTVGVPAMAGPPLGAESIEQAFGVPLGEEPASRFGAPQGEEAAPRFGVPLGEVPVEPRLRVPLGEEPVEPRFGVPLREEPAPRFGVPRGDEPGAQLFSVPLGEVPGGQSLGVPLGEVPVEPRFGSSLGAEPEAPRFGAPLGEVPVESPFSVPLREVPGGQSLGVPLGEVSGRESLEVPLGEEPVEQRFGAPLGEEPVEQHVGADPIEASFGGKPRTETMEPSFRIPAGEELVAAFSAPPEGERVDPNFGSSLSEALLRAKSSEQSSEDTPPRQTIAKAAALPEPSKSVRTAAPVPKPVVVDDDDEFDENGFPRRNNTIRNVAIAGVLLLVAIGAFSLRQSNVVEAAEPPVEQKKPEPAPPTLEPRPAKVTAAALSKRIEKFDAQLQALEARRGDADDLMRQLSLKAKADLAKASTEARRRDVWDYLDDIQIQLDKR